MRGIANILIVVSILACAPLNAKELKITHGPYLQHATRTDVYRLH